MNDDAIVFLILIVVVALVISFTIYVFFLLTLSKCLSRIASANREMEPGQVWLNLIPIFGTFWAFFTVLRVGASLKKEYKYRQWPAEGNDFGVNIGLVYLVCGLLGVIPYIGFIFSLMSLVTFIMYWVKIAGFSNVLATESSARLEDDEFDDLDRRANIDDDRWNSHAKDEPPDERIQKGD